MELKRDGKLVQITETNGQGDISLLYEKGFETEYEAQDFEGQFALGKIKNSKRGLYQSMDPFEVRGVAEPDYSNTVKKIGQAEYDILVNKSEDTLGLYANDNGLIEKYMRTNYKDFISACLLSPQSKNNVAHIVGGCLSLIHFTPECLTVVSRSLDYDAAVRTDEYIAWLFMRATGAKSYRIIFLNPHRYLTKKGINRRAKDLVYSNCSKEVVCCKLYSKNFLKEVIGYNYLDDDLELCANCDPKTCGVIHAEVAAVKNWDSGEVPYWAFVTKEPCGPCRQALLDAGVKEIIVVQKESLM